MGIATWILVVDIFANLCILVHPRGKFPDFFYDDDTESFGYKVHKHKLKPKLPKVEMETGYYPAVPKDSQEKPANALPIHEPPGPFYTINKEFKIIGRGDAKDQNIIEQQEMQDGDSIFPPPDGKPFNDDDNYDLDELPKRLTQTNRWDEFNELIDAQKEKYKGTIMKDWHENAHMWASYSRHLLEREKYKQKATPRTISKLPKIDPSVGLSAYWGPSDNNQSPAGSPAGPWGQGKGPGAGIENMKDLGGPEDAQEPFPWDPVGGQGPVEGPGGLSLGGGPPPGLGQGGQFLGGGVPPGMNQGVGQGPGGQFPGGGFNMGDGPLPGFDQGGGRGPGGGFGMGGGLPPGLGQGPGGQFPGGGFNMGDGPPPGFGQGGGPGPSGGFGMGGGLPPGMGQGPGGQFPGGGFNMDDGPPPGFGQGGGRGPSGGFGMGGGFPPGMGQGPGGQFPGGGFNMNDGPPPGFGQGGGRGPGGGFSMGGGLPPGKSQSGGQGPGGQFPGSGSSMDGAPPPLGLKPGKGMVQNGVQGPGSSQDPDGSYEPVEPPGPAGGWVPGGGRGPAGGLAPGMGRGPGMAHGPARIPGSGRGLGLGKGRSPGGSGGVWGPGGGPGMSQDPSKRQGPDEGYGPFKPPGPAGGWHPGRGRGPGWGQKPGMGPGISPAMGLGPGGLPGSGDGWGPGEGPRPGMGRDQVLFNDPGGPLGTGSSWGPGGGPSPGIGRSPGGPQGPARPPGSGGPPGRGAHRRSIDQTKKDGEKNLGRVPYYEVMIRPTRTPETMAPQLDDRFLIPGTHAEDNIPEQETNIDLLRSLSAKPVSNNPFVTFDEHMNEDQVPTGSKDGKIPGPGSEGEYPNGYRPIYGNLKQPGMASPGGNFGMDQRHTGVGYSKTLRQGQGANSGPGDYQDSIQNAVRMGGQESPGIDAEESFQTGMAGGNMGRGSLSGNMQVWPPGIKGAPPPPPGHKLRGQWPPGYMQEEQAPGMGGGPPPRYMQGRHPPGTGEGPPSGYMQEEQPPGMGEGPPPGYMQGGQPSMMLGDLPPRYMPPSYEGYRRSLDNSTVDRGGYLMPLGPTFRHGGGLTSMEDNTVSGDYPEMIKTALRMNQMMAQSPDGGGLPPGYMQGGPPRGTERGPPPGYLRGGSPLEMGGGSPPGYMQGGPPPGMEGRPPPGYMQGGPHPGMAGGPPAGYMQGGPPLGIGGGPPSGYMQGGPPPGMAGGLSPEFQGRPKGSPAISGFPSGMPQGQMERPPPDFPDYGGPDGSDPSLQYGSQGSPRPNNKYPSGYQLMKIALRKIEFQNRLDRIKAQPSGPTTEHLPTVEERLQTLRQFDDFHAPIRWVKLNSPDTKDGLARVTDKKTHQNQQFVIEGELYVPIVDESMARLGWTTESDNETLIEITTIPNVDEYGIKIVMRSMNLNYTSQQEWLAYETILGAKFNYEHECAEQACQSRCHKTGCDCTCKGDSCASGCVGVGCNAVCRGPGCNAMCIGEQCTAKCEGLNCDAKCWGTHCSSSCSRLSCSYTMNGGRTHVSNLTWDEAYPQYGQKFSNRNPDVNVPVQRQGQDYGHAADDYYHDNE